MNKIKIGIVEDEMIIVETIVLALAKLGYEIAGTAGTYEEGLEMISLNQPDLMLLDINLGTKKDGIDLAITVKERFDIPIIFLTANSDAATIERAKEIQPLAFIVKPFSQQDLFSAIEIGWNNYNTIRNAEGSPQEEIVLKVGATSIKVLLDDITYLKNDHHYFDVHFTSGKMIVVRYTTRQMIALLPKKQFAKVNRSCIVNVRYITKIESKFVHLSEIKLRISKDIKEELLLKI